MQELSSKFMVGVTNRNKRAVATTEPELKVVAGSATGKSKIAINEAASKLLSIGHRDYMDIVSNRSQVEQAIADENPDILEWAEENDKSPHDFPVSYFVVKAWMKLDDAGKPIMVKDRLSNAEREALANELEKDVDDLTPDDIPNVEEMTGFKVATSTKNAKKGEVGYIVEGSDSINWPYMGGNTVEHVIYSIGKDPIEAELDGETRKLFPLTFNRRENKIERHTSGE